MNSKMCIQYDFERQFFLASSLQKQGLLTTDRQGCMAFLL